MIVKVEENDIAFFITNKTGSTYYLRKAAIGLNSMSANILHTLLNQTEYATVAYQDLESITKLLEKFKD
jgi:hypothetical protein